MAVKKEAAVEAPVAEEKAAPKKEAVKKAPAKKTTAAKKAEAAPEVKEEAPKKAPVKKAAKKAAPEASVTVQFQGRNIVTAQVVEAAAKAFAEANPDVEIKTIDVYVKPEENVAYYAVNGEGSEDYKVEL